MPAEHHATDPGAQGERGGRGSSDGGVEEPLACQQVRGGGEHRGGVRGVPAREGRLQLAAQHRQLGAPPAVGDLHRVVDENGSERGRRHRHEDVTRGPARPAKDQQGNQSADGGVRVVLARQRADGRERRQAEPPAPDGALEGVVPPLHDASAREEGERGGGAERGQADGPERSRARAQGGMPAAGAQRATVPSSVCSTCINAARSTGLSRMAAAPTRALRDSVATALTTTTGVARSTSSP